MKIQNYRNSIIFENYEAAVKHIETVLVNDPNIVDGQEIFARYNHNGKVVTIIAAAYVDSNGDISFTIVNDGMSIISSEEEPSEEYRDNYIWLQEVDDSSMVDDGITHDLRSMQRAINELYSIVNQFKYAFENEMNCGTVTNNSTRMQLMSEAEPEIPMGYEDGSVVFLLSSYENGEILSDETFFKSSDNGDYIDIDDTWVINASNANLSKVNNFLWLYKKITYSSGEIINSEPYVFCLYNEDKIIDSYINYYYLSNDDISVPDKTEVEFSVNLLQPTEEKQYLYCYVECSYAEDEDEYKPTYYSESTPNVKHLIIKSAQTEKEIKDNILNLCDNELVWCEGNNGLYIRSKGKIVKINGTASGGDNNNDDDIMNGIISNGEYIGSIDFVSTSNKVYRMKVNDYGKMEVYTSNLDSPDEVYESKYAEGVDINALFVDKFFINSFYCGGEGDDINEHSFNPCSHNFVELSNLTDNDINLNGFSLQYATVGNAWESLPLWGVIPAGGTFLIRGAQCSVMDANTTVIKVKDFDMEWYVEKTVDGVRTKKLIQFSSDKSKFFLKYGTKPYNKNGAYEASGNTVTLSSGYVDFIGACKDGVTAPEAEGEPFNKLSDKYLIKKYYSMDNVKQAVKVASKRSNANDLCYIDLTRDDILPNVIDYTPKTSKANKNFFYDKTKLKEMKPSTITVSFGIQATDNTNIQLEDGVFGSGATRCFNWVSKGYYDEFIWFKKLNNDSEVFSLTKDSITSEWKCIESYKGASNELFANNNSEHGYPSSLSIDFYKRIQQETSNHELCTSHKVILRKLTSGTYAYCCGKKNDLNLPLDGGCSDIRIFTVRTDDDVNSGFTFVHTSDQQGFNWDEYEVWKYAARCINERNPSDISRPQFVLNTGDATQNGNRINEWLDYFNGREPLKNLEEVYTIGNNDLCPVKSYMAGDGNDISKINPVNITYFYTFELDEGNLPVFTFDVGEIYIPSLYSFNYGFCHFLCVNSEISPKAEEKLYGFNDSGNVYVKVKEWCEKDMSSYSAKTSGWNIAYCHEMPFTILTSDKLNSYYKQSDGTIDTSKNREGSRINTNINVVSLQYWFSKLCQDTNIRLVMGGHKHTQAISWPIKENYGIEGKHSMQPTIQVTLDDLDKYFNNSNSLVTITAETADSAIKGKQYPSDWCVNGDIKNGDYKIKAHYCEFELVDNITAPVYSMSQATGYKHTSNKELPAPKIPWLRHYYPSEGGKANPNQKMPFYTYVTINNNQIQLDVKRLSGLMNGGKFNINVEGENAKYNLGSIVIGNGLNPDIESDNKLNVIISK